MQPAPITFAHGFVSGAFVVRQTTRTMVLPAAVTKSPAVALAFVLCPLAAPVPILSVQATTASRRTASSQAGGCKWAKVLVEKCR